MNSASRARHRRSGSALMSVRTSRLARGEHLRPAPRTGPDLEHRDPGRDQLEQHLVDQRLLPLGRRTPLLAAAGPVVAIPPGAVRSCRVAAPAAMRAAQVPAPLLGDEPTILDRPARPPQCVPQPSETVPQRPPPVRSIAHTCPACSPRPATLTEALGALAAARLRLPRRAHGSTFVTEPLDGFTWLEACRVTFTAC